MDILAIDLGKQKSVGILYNTESGQDMQRTFRTTPQVIHDLLVEWHPDRVVIEIGPPAGWVHDLVVALEIEIQVANPNHEAWRWRNIKCKTDRLDALKLAKLSAMNQLPTVYMPSPKVRQWRSLIAFRHRLIAERTRVKNQIRAILHSQGIAWPSGPRGWTKPKKQDLKQLARPLDQVDAEDFWRGQLWIELRRLTEVQAHIQQVEVKLESQAQESRHVKLLRTIPGVGPRLSEMIVALTDNPNRFDNRKQVSSYVGMVPSQHQSGNCNRHGRITRNGNRLLRSLLVEVSWLMRRYNPWLRGVFDHVSRGIKTRRKIAVIAAARRLMICCWAMMRDGTPWRDPLSVPGAATPV